MNSILSYAIKSSSMVLSHIRLWPSKKIKPGWTLALIILSTLNTLAFAENATLTWNPNTESDLSGYKVYYGTSSGSYGLPIDVGDTTTHSLSGLGSGTTYYFAVTAYDTSGNESGFSSEVNKSFPSTDTTAPVISGTAAGSITTSSANISWTTDEASDTQIQYGTSTSYDSSTTADSTLLTSHNGTLSGLSASTLYHYRVLSRDAAGNLATSGDNTFTTLTPPDTTPPAISGITSTSVSATGATISWTTDEASDTRIEYGTTTSYGALSSLDSNLLTSHSQNLNGLLASTTYHYRVLSRDAANNLASSGDNTFTTQSPADTTEPVISGIAVSNINASSAVVTWTTNEGATSTVEYGTTTAYGSSSSIGTTYVGSHSRTLSGLSDATTYQYRVVSTDAAGNTAISGNNSFTTTSNPDSTAPVISTVTASNISSTGAIITWTTDEAATSKVEYGITNAYGSTTTISNTLVTSHSQTLSGLSPATTIHYRVTSQDGTGNTAMSGDKTFTTGVASDNTGPVISSVTVQNISASNATLTWTTDEPATSQIEFGPSASYGASTTKNETLQMSHNQIITGLTENTSYHFRVKSTDGSGNLSTTSDASFQTAAAETGDTTPPGDIQSFTAVGGSRQVALSWINPEDSDFVGVRIRYRTDRFPTDINDGQLLGDISGAPSAGISTTHTGLADGSTYFYLAASYDDSGNFQSTVFVSAITKNAASNTTSGAATSGGGGCGMIRPGGGDPPTPGDAAAMLSLIGVLIFVWLKKGVCRLNASIFKT